MLKALSLLELIVVMGIVAALMGLGILALSSYRNSVNLQSAYTDAVTFIKVLQNKSTSSSSITDSSGVRITPDFYALNFENNAISPYYCVLSGGFGSLVHCDAYPSLTASTYLSSYDVNVTANCSGVGFGRLSANFVSIDSSGFVGNSIYVDSGTCVLTLTHNVTGDTRIITFDLDKNKIDL